MFFFVYENQQNMGQKQSVSEPKPDYQFHSLKRKGNGYVLFEKNGWISVPNKKHFLIHDNGGRPFLVLLDGKHVTIKARNEDIETHIQYDKILFDEKVKNIWIACPRYRWDGKDKTNINLAGHTILLQRQNGKYVFVGRKLYEFKSPEPILSFDSFITGSDVYESWAKTKNHGVLFELNNKSFPLVSLDEIQDWHDPYEEYYQDRKMKFKSIPVKILK